jgi:hypothetical protein
MRTPTCLAILLTSASITVPVALAGTPGAQTASHPTAYCQTALPVFDGNVRKRPLAVQNEGTGPAFVTCSYPTPEGRVPGSSVTTRVWQYVLNTSASPVTINCTGVASTSTHANAQYVVKSLVVNPGAGEQVINWYAADFEDSPAVFPNQGIFSVSCSLPSGAGLGVSYINASDVI